MGVKSIGIGAIAAIVLQACTAETSEGDPGPIALQQPSFQQGQPDSLAGMGGPMQPPVNADRMNPPPVNPGPMNPPPVDPDPMNPPPVDPDPMNPPPVDPDPMDPDPMNPPPGDGPQPRIPAVSGDCPDLRDGSTISVAGHGGIAITAGAAGMGGPLLFYWHGTGGSASEAQRTLPAAVRRDITDSGGIIASFNGRDSSGTEGDCSGTGAHNMADFKAADQIVACAVQNHGIDPRRIYSTGCSAGGLQTGCMAAQRSSYVAAVAPNSGGVVFPQRLEDPSHVPALFTMHGGSGDNVIVNFGTTSETLGNAFTGAGGFWIDCNHMSGHCGARGAIQESAWEFLKAHPFGTETSPYASGLPAGFPSYCQIK